MGIKLIEIFILDQCLDLHGVHLYISFVIIFFVNISSVYQDLHNFLLAYTYIKLWLLMSENVIPPLFEYLCNPLTHLSRMELSNVINWTSPLAF